MCFYLKMVYMNGTMIIKACNDARHVYASLEAILYSPSRLFTLEANGRSFMCHTDGKKKKKRSLLAFVLLAFALTVVIFQDNEHRPRIAAIGSLQTYTSVLAPAVKNPIGLSGAATHRHTNNSR